MTVATTAAATFGFGVLAACVAGVIAAIGGLFVAADRAYRRERAGRLRALKRAHDAETRAAEAEQAAADAEADAQAWYEAYERAVRGEVGGTWVDHALAEIHDLPEWDGHQ